MKIFIAITFMVFVILYPYNSLSSNTRERTAKYSGMCDASAAVPLDSIRFIVANDEDNTLRIYRNDMPSLPIKVFDLDMMAGEKNSEMDIEGATSDGKKIYWITSHGRNKNGLIRTDRFGLFLTETRIVENDIIIALVGSIYKNLLQDLLSENKFDVLGIADACKLDTPKDKTLAPKNKGLNIEGLSLTSDGQSLLIAFRNPRPQNKALIITLKNPDSVILHKEKAIFATPILLDFGGLGIRSIEYSSYLSAYLIMAGPGDEPKKFALYQWSGRPNDQPIVLKGHEFFSKLSKYTPEAIVVYPDRKDFQILSDDGDIEMSQVKQKNPGSKKKCKCKDLPDHELRSFRSIWIHNNQVN